jgi:hypothetical protein
MIELDTIDYNAVSSTEYDPLTPIDMDATIDMRGLPVGGGASQRVSTPVPDDSTDSRSSRTIRKFNFSLA